MIAVTQWFVNRHVRLLHRNTYDYSDETEGDSGDGERAGRSLWLIPNENVNAKMDAGFFRLREAERGRRSGATPTERGNTQAEKDKFH